MTLVDQVKSLIVRDTTEFKLVYAKIGSLGSLTTSDKTNLVAAINEVVAAVVGGGGASINDTTPSTSSVYSSSKTEAILATGLALKPVINDSTATSTDVYSSSKVVAVTAAAVANRPIINDVTASGTAVYSSTHVDAQIATAVANLVNGAPGLMDTLGEIATALGNDESSITTITTGLTFRLRFDAAQTLSGPQKTQGLTNLGAVPTTDIGDVTFDFVAYFEANLV